MKHLLIAVLVMLGSYGTVQAADPTKFTFCGGADGGYYNKIAEQLAHDLKSRAKLDVAVTQTGGSVENAEGLKDGSCTAAIVQADVGSVKSLPVNIKATDSHQETIYWMHGVKGLENFTDLSDEKNAARFRVATVAGSGAEVTLQNFGIADKDYEKVFTVKFDDWLQAAEAVANGYTVRNGGRVEIAGLIYVGRPNNISSDITSRFATKIKIGSISESAFKTPRDSNGNPLYFSCKIDQGKTNGLETDSWSKPSTYCLNAQIVVNQDYYSTLDKATARNLQRKVDETIIDAVNAMPQ